MLWWWWARQRWSETGLPSVWAAVCRHVCRRVDWVGANGAASWSAVGCSAESTCWVRSRGRRATATAGGDGSTAGVLGGRTMTETRAGVWWSRLPCDPIHVTCWVPRSTRSPRTREILYRNRAPHITCTQPPRDSPHHHCESWHLGLMGHGSWEQRTVSPSLTHSTFSSTSNS